MSPHAVDTTSFAFPLKPQEYAPEPVPSLEEWQQLWKAWNLVTTKMFPRECLMEKPIPLRNPLLFYLGHIPTFEDIHLTRATGSVATEPAVYHVLFERGIDPDVDDPTMCHDHSELPDVWPTVDEILGYRERVCARITALYENGQAQNDKCVGRALWIGFEHEGLHLETFLYMTLQSTDVLPPPGPRPDFVALAKKAAGERVKNQWFRIASRRFTIGFDDPESDDGPDRFFAWDNEREPYEVNVSAFEAQARPISIGEYVEYLFETNKTDQTPVMWTKNTKYHGNNGLSNEQSRSISDHPAEVSTDGSLESFIDGIAFKTVYGPVPLKHTLDWPLVASYNEVDEYAKWAGARIPTLHEVRSIHEQVEDAKAANKSKEEKGLKPNPDKMFVDLTDRNVGFQNFHHTPVTQNGDRLCGLGDMGGAWEWSSTLFAPQPNFKPMDIYPGYSADFMDGKHVAITGGSWAVHPRIAGRKTFLNWWQKNYLWPWVAVRLVRDIS